MTLIEQYKKRKFNLNKKYIIKILIYFIFTLFFIFFIFLKNIKNNRKKQEK